MPKPITDTLATHVQDAVAKFEDVVKHHVANNPKMAMEDKMASLVENSGAFKGHAHSMQVENHGAAVSSQAVAGVVVDQGKGTGR